MHPCRMVRSVRNKVCRSQRVKYHVSFRQMQVKNSFLKTKIPRLGKIVCQRWQTSFLRSRFFRIEIHLAAGVSNEWKRDFRLGSGPFGRDKRTTRRSISTRVVSRHSARVPLSFFSYFFFPLTYPSFGWLEFNLARRPDDPRRNHRVSPDYYNRPWDTLAMSVLMQA